jgi:hypothetical protein
MPSSEQGLNGFVSSLSTLSISIFTKSSLFSDCECNIRQTEKKLAFATPADFFEYNIGRKHQGHWTAKYTRMLNFKKS